MGYWNTTPDGASFAVSDEMLWGDAPADAIDNAVDRFKDTFASEVGRPMTAADLTAGGDFVLGAASRPADWPDTVSHALGDAIAAAKSYFAEDVNRPPTNEELRAGIRFSAGGFAS